MERQARPWLRATFEARPLASLPVREDDVVAAMEQIGTSPTGNPWDCGACGYRTCREFSEAVVRGRTSLRLCPSTCSGRR
jgi:Na+-translocating ferredoxin:NAD+ oxidoreductase RNF subunit RnfB